MATVFIGIMTYNRPELVREAIESVLRQSYRDYRVVVSDNCSQAEASESVANFVGTLNDDRFSFYRQPVNVGEYGQGRYLFEQAGDSEFFLILHDDDVLGPDYLSKGLERLQTNPDCAFFVANPTILDSKGDISSGETERYLKHQGRLGKAEGEFDVETRHMNYGFAPISGTLFRTRALQDSGFVNPDGYGNFPFECDIYIRLGERGAKAWFDPDSLLSFRFHPGSQRNNIDIMGDAGIVEQMLALFVRPCHLAANNRRRKVVLSRIYRALALLCLQSGDHAGARKNLCLALNNNSFSMRAWSWTLAVLLSPALARTLLPRFRKSYT